jgi:hypothetical protein
MWYRSSLRRCSISAPVGVDITSSIRNTKSSQKNLFWRLTFYFKFLFHLIAQTVNNIFARINCLLHILLATIVVPIWQHWFTNGKYIMNNLINYEIVSLFGQNRMTSMESKKLSTGQCQKIVDPQFFHPSWSTGNH